MNYAIKVNLGVVFVMLQLVIGWGARMSSVIGYEDTRKASKYRDKHESHPLDIPSSCIQRLQPKTESLGFDGTHLDAAYRPALVGEGFIRDFGVEALNELLPVAKESTEVPKLKGHQRNRVSSKKAWLARFSLATVACLYGTEYAAIKVMGGLLGTSTLLALRFTLASVTLLPALSNIKAKVLMDGAEVGMYATLGYWAQAGALQIMPAAQLAVLGSTAVLVVPILDHFSGKRKVGMTTIFAALLACLGTILLQSEDLEAGKRMGTGDVVLSYLLAIAQTIFFAISTWRMEAAVTRHPGQSVALTAAQVVVVGICSAAWAVLESACASGWPEASGVKWADPWVIAGLLWLGLVTTTIVLLLETGALESVSASEATVIYSLDPVVGAGIASSVLGEPFGSNMALGASLVLGSCLYSSLGAQHD